MGMLCFRHGLIYFNHYEADLIPQSKNNQNIIAIIYGIDGASALPRTVKGDNYLNVVGYL